MSNEKTIFKQWVVLELMGHRRVGAFAQDDTIGGATVLRVDIPKKDGSWSTSWYPPGSWFGIHATTEELARAVAASSDFEPVHQWELPQPKRETIRDMPSGGWVSKMGDDMASGTLGLYYDKSDQDPDWERDGSGDEEDEDDES